MENVRHGFQPEMDVPSVAAGYLRSERTILHTSGKKPKLAGACSTRQGHGPRDEDDVRNRALHCQARAASSTAHS